MILEKERNLVVQYGNKMLKDGLTKGTGGNISIFNREKALVAISPSGLNYDETNPEDVVVITLDGEVVEGHRKPSSELELHLIFYRKREDINALVHTHSPFAKTLASLQWDLPPVSYLVAYAGANVRCAKYATFGTKELADNVFEAMIDRKAALLANHGLIAGADELDKAYTIAEQIEFSCEIYYRSKTLGEPVLLDEAEMENLAEKFKSYGRTKEQGLCPRD